jgi:hypothetical protein
MMLYCKVGGCYWSPMERCRSYVMRSGSDMMRSGSYMMRSGSNMMRSRSDMMRSGSYMMRSMMNRSWTSMHNSMLNILMVTCKHS